MKMADEIKAFEETARRAGVGIADILRAAGIDRSMWTRWKNGTTVPRLDNWRAIERALAELSIKASAA